jgi:hypothetical protein
MVGRSGFAAPVVLAVLIFARRGRTQTTLPTFAQISTEDYGKENLQYLVCLAFTILPKQAYITREICFLDRHVSSLLGAQRRKRTYVL